jgi:hypothetical protein
MIGLNVWSLLESFKDKIVDIKYWFCAYSNYYLVESISKTSDQYVTIAWLLPWISQGLLLAKNYCM